VVILVEFTRGLVVTRLCVRCLFGFLAVAFAALVFLGFDFAGLVGVSGEERGAGFVRAGFVDGEVGGDFVLEAEFPGVGFGGVVFPEAVVGHGETWVGATLFADAG